MVHLAPHTLSKGSTQGLTKRCPLQQVVHLVISPKVQGPDFATQTLKSTY